MKTGGRRGRNGGAGGAVPPGQRSGAVEEAGKGARSGAGPAVLTMAATGAAAAAGAAAAGLAGMSARPLGAAEPLSLGSLRGKVLLVANVASL